MATLPRTAFSASASASPASTRSSIFLSISVSMRLTKKLATLAMRSIGWPLATRASRPASHASATPW